MARGACLIGLKGIKAQDAVVHVAQPVGSDQLLNDHAHGKDVDLYAVGISQNNCAVGKHARERLHRKAVKEVSRPDKRYKSPTLKPLTFETGA